MLRLVNSVKNLALTIEAFNSNCNNLQIVRWRRKPRWLPVAKSKLYKVPTRPVIPIEEKLELQRLYNNYRTQIKSIRRFLTYKHCTRFLASFDPEQHRKIFEEDFARCQEINEKWNAEQKVLREKRVSQELEKEIQFAKNRMVLEAENKEIELQKAEDLVREQKAVADTFITAENIDAAIEHALTNTVDYNFAIDLQGNKIVGRETNPEPSKEQISVKQ